MCILILYLSKHGTVEEVVKIMKNLSGEEVEMKKITGKEQSFSKIDSDRIAAFIESF